MVLAFCPHVLGRWERGMVAGKGAARVRIWQRVGVGGWVLSDKERKVREL